MPPYPAFRFPSPNVQANSAFSPAQIDFTQISRIADSYYGAKNDALRREAAQDELSSRREEAARDAQFRQMFAQGIPKDAQGNLDLSAAADRLIRMGDPKRGLELLGAASQEADRRYSREFDREKFNADQTYRQQQLGLEREKINANRKDTDTRLQHLDRLGIDPNSSEGLMYLANGRLPAEFYKNQAQEARKKATAPKIAEGLTNLSRMTEQYNDPAFLNSLGPVQGSTPDGLIDKALINTGRLYGEVANWYEGGNATPNEVRNNIVGATEALAAAIKPLIRAPGEGVWTDADQARLVAIVGDLSQARNKDEFRRRLNAVRDRIQSNFGLEIPFDAVTRGADPIAEARDAISRGAPRAKVIQRLLQNGITPPKGL